MKFYSRFYIGVKIGASELFGFRLKILTDLLANALDADLSVRFGRP